MKVFVVTKQPPGGRCTLYMRFADAVADVVGGQAGILYPLPDEPLPPAPALLIDGHPVQPADGVLLTADEVCDAVLGAGFGGDVSALRERLRQEEAQALAAWGVT